MAGDIRDLIEKIQQEGIGAAEKKAKAIEEEAKRQADDILSKAEKEAQDIIARARGEADQTSERTKSLLSQAARDLFLSIREEVNSMLKRLITSEIGQAMDTGDLERIIADFIKTHGQHGKEEILIGLKKEDAKILENGFLKKLSQEVRKKIVLKTHGDIKAGFTISFDSGKSCYDFTDKAIAEYIGQHLKPALNELFKNAISGK
jgi:V/A-type H+-transporting ATPase subunit E